eukprot:GABV01000263.1.p1 GENE.GABV01000263.1~~GABV01000263.1.p1  ORF type:complete len:335 (-),score=88.98 GABV01000263.1:365-1369(-)
MNRRLFRSTFLTSDRFILPKILRKFRSSRSFVRVLCDVLATRQPVEYELLDAVVPSISEFESLYISHGSDEFVAKNMMKLAVHLDMQDEAGRPILIRLMENAVQNLSTPEPIIGPAFALARLLYDREAGLVHRTLEMISELRDNLEQENDDTKVPTNEEFQDLAQKLEELRQQKKDAIESEDFQQAHALKAQIANITMQLEKLDDSLNLRERMHRSTWERVIALVSGLLDSCRTHSIESSPELSALKPIIFEASSDPDPFIRNAAFRALGFWGLIDVSTAEEGAKLMIQVVEKDQEALQLTALRVLLDWSLLHSSVAENSSAPLETTLPLFRSF